MTTDLKVEDHGSIFLLRGATQVGKDWLDENVQRAGYQPNSSFLVVEHRYIEAIIVGAINDGLTVS